MPKGKFLGEKRSPREISRLLSSLGVLIFLFFYLTVGILVQVYPGVLGISSQIDPLEIVRLTNEQRVRNGLLPLRVSPVLASAAVKKGENMFRENYWAHISPSGKDPWYWLDQTGYLYTVAGENLAKDFADASSIVSAWMASPSHRANILNRKYKEIGVAVLEGELKGLRTTLVVQMLATPKTESQLAVKPLTIKTELPLQPEPPSFLSPQAFPPKALSPKVEAKKMEKISLSPFYLFKIVAICLVVLLLGVLFVDLWAVLTGQIEEVGSHSLAHILLLLILLLAVAYTNVGVII